MDESQNETIIINNLLCFVASKYRLFSLDYLAKAIQEFYSDDVLKDACETLQEANLEHLGTDIFDPENIPKTIETIVTYMHQTPEEDLPLFVCKDLNNLPFGDTSKKKKGKNNKKTNLQEYKALSEEYCMMKGKITEITQVITFLKDQLENMAGERDLSTERLRNQRRKRSSSILERKSGLAYLQELIDQEDRNNDLKPPLKKYLKDDSDDDSHVEECENDLIQELGRYSSLYSQTNSRVSKSGKKNSAKVISVSSNLQIKTEAYLEEESIIEETRNAKKGPQLKKSVLERSIFICPFCKFKSENRETLQKHIQLHSESNMYSADGEDSNSVIKSEDGTHQCLLCLEEFCHRKELEEHINKCPTMSFDDLSPADPSEKHVCPVCNVIFSTKFSLMNHKGYHDQARAFECSICGYRFFTRENLEVHHKVHTEGIYKCPYCEYGNATKKRVITHIHCHTGFRPYKCTMCSYRSSTNTALERHIAAHSGERNLHCTECDSSFKTKDKLIAHKRLHIKRRPFKCPECGKGFKHSTAMKTHYRTHTNERPHACPLCPYKARTASVLRIHLNIHSAEKPFKCDLCDFKANQKSYLNWHVKAYHPQSLNI